MKFAAIKEDLISAIKKREAESRALSEAYPKVTKWCWRTLSIMIVLWIFLFSGWRVLDHINAYANSYAEERISEYQSEQEELARQKQRDLQAAQETEQQRREKEVILIAKLLKGLDNFVENYGYTSDDLITYAECPLNRVLNPAFACESIEEAIMQPDQWVGFNENNEVTQANYKLARFVVNDFYTNPIRIVESKYCWAELNKDGCYLKDKVELDPYSRTWRYSSNG